LDHPGKFQRVSRLRFVTAPTSLKLCTVFGRLRAALIHCSYVFGALAPSGILPRAKFTLRQSLAFSYIGIVTEWQLSSGRQPNCGGVQGMGLRNFRSLSFSTEGVTCIPRAAITLGIGPRSSFLSFWATVCKTVRPVLLDRRPVLSCLSCYFVLGIALVDLSVCL